MDISFLFPRRIDSAIAGLGEAKNLAGESPPPDSDPFGDAEFGKTPPVLKTIRRERESPFPVPQTQSAYHPRAQRNAFLRAERLRSI